MESVGFQNFVQDKACLEVANCLELVLLLLKSFLVPDVKDWVWVLDQYVWDCLGLDDMFGSLGILKALIDRWLADRYPTALLYVRNRREQSSWKVAKIHDTDVTIKTNKKSKNDLQKIITSWMDEMTEDHNKSKY